MISVILYIFVGWMLFSLTLAYIGIKEAQVVDDREPFLHGDYDQYTDYYNKFCENCIFLDKDGKCLHRSVIQPITRDIIDKCKKESMFEAK